MSGGKVIGKALEESLREKELDEKGLRPVNKKALEDMRRIEEFIESQTGFRCVSSSCEKKSSATFRLVAK